MITSAAAAELVGKIATIIEWGDDEEGSTITYTAAEITGFYAGIGSAGSHLTIKMSGPAPKVDIEEGEDLGAIPAEPAHNVFIWNITEVTDVHAA